MSSSTPISPAPFVRVGDTLGPFVFTCEHATNAVPAPLSPSESDRMFLEQHWGWDIGAANVARALCEHYRCSGMQSTFSRLVADPNREVVDPTYILREIDGTPISFNADLDDREVQRRIETYTEPYHSAIDALLGEHSDAGVATHLVAVHSFTPVWNGNVRTMEVGVLFDDHEDDAVRLHDALSRCGFIAALNEPYSGKHPHGLIYGAQRHGRARGIKYVELEIRQNLIAEPDDARDIAARIARALEVFRPLS